MGRVENWRNRLLAWIKKMWKALCEWGASPAFSQRPNAHAAFSVINGVQFVTADNLRIEVFLGQTMHLSHPGDCTPEMHCTLTAIKKIVLDSNPERITIESDEAQYSFLDAKVRTIFKLKG